MASIYDLVTADWLKNTFLLGIDLTLDDGSPYPDVIYEQSLRGEHHVCESQQDNEQVNQFLKKHNMEPVYVPWRHRYFWDGGLHCITLDLEREGGQEDYFPDRSAGIVDLGFDED